MMTHTYIDGTYLDKNPDWHVQDSAWKAKQVMKMIDLHQLKIESICEVGCGAGEVLHQLYLNLPENSMFHGYEISPQGFELCQQRTEDRLHFYCEDLLSKDDAFFQLLLVLDVFEHVEDYFGFLRQLRSKATLKIFHIPLDISVQTVFRASPILYVREAVGHLHYFTKETALKTLTDTGYEIVDHFYTGVGLDAPDITFKRSLLKLPRKMLYRFHQDLTVRILGGFSLLVLAR